MNSVLSLINFLLLYNLKQVRYDKVIFLLIFRVLYINNYENQLYNSLNNYNNIASTNYFFKKTNIINNSDSISSSDSHFTLHNTDVYFKNFNSDISSNYDNEQEENLYDITTDKAIDSINDYIDYDDINNLKTIDNTIDLNNITRTLEESNFNNIRTDFNISEKDDMLYDLESLLYFLMLYTPYIPNYDSIILLLLELNYYIKLFLYPIMLEQCEFKMIESECNNSIHNNTYSLTSNIQQIQLSNNINFYEANSEYKVFFNISAKSHDVTTKVPSLIISCTIDDIFKGDLMFDDYITDINNISNGITITTCTLIIDTKNNNLGGILFLEGYLKTNVDSLIPVNYSSNILNSMYRNNIICTPFSLAKNIELNSDDFNISCSYNNLELDITKVSFNTKRILKNKNKINSYFDLYSQCELIIEVSYTLNIYKLEDIYL